MASLGSNIEQACKALGLKVEVGAVISFEDGTNVKVVAHIPELGRGWKNGIVIFNSYDVPISKKLANAGYGFSVIGDPSEKQKFDLDGWRETFIDWGWGGKSETKPKWMSEPPLDELEEALRNSSSEVAREEAAQRIALIHWENERSQQILVERIRSGLIDSELRYWCIDSLADIWIKKGEINRKIYDELGDDDLKAILAPWFKELEN